MAVAKQSVVHVEHLVADDGDGERPVVQPTLDDAEKHRAAVLLMGGHNGACRIGGNPIKVKENKMNNDGVCMPLFVQQCLLVLDTPYP